MTQILFFGDSIAYGAWDIEGGLAQRLRKFLDKKVIDSNYEKYFITYNLGIDGDTSSGLLKRFDLEVKPRIFPDEESIFIFLIGDNDSLYNNKTKKFLISKENFKNNIGKIISQAKKYSEKIIFLGSFPIDDSKTDPWDENGSYKNEYLSQYREVLKNLCLKENCHFLSFEEHLDKKNWKQYLPDGLHPDTKGYDKLFEILRNYLVKNKII